MGHTNIVALLLMSRADPEYRSSQGHGSTTDGLRTHGSLIGPVARFEGFWYLIELHNPQVIDTALGYATNM